MNKQEAETRKLDQSVAVSFDYPVVFTADVFAPDNAALLDAMTRLGETRRHRAAVYLDAGVVQHRPQLACMVENYFLRHPNAMELAAPPRVVPGGEAIKSDLARIRDIIGDLAALKLDRHAFVIIVGGGAVLDAVGFAASLIHRGLRVIRVPTTVLAQNDAGVGVKTGINFLGGKNMLGTFAPPFAVINDFDFLFSLSDAHWTDGIAEAFKVAIIKDAGFFDWLFDHAPALAKRDQPAMEHLVVRCAELHLEHIRGGGDPFEMGRARPLDFGHWSAHRLEVMSGYAVSHGQAVAIGIALDACYAAKKMWLSRDQYLRVCAGLRAAGFALWHPLLARRDAAGRLDILQGLRDFQEHLGGELCITMPQGLGRKFEVHEMEEELIEACILELKAAV
ncbi:MAG: 3-dehydroquinate synthase [bacterium]